MTKPDGSKYPEVLGTRLDLTRPEPTGLLQRYSPRSALIVGRSSDDTIDLRAALLEDGWRSKSCIGPKGVNCPLLRGKGVCTKRECADIAVVFVDAAHSVSGSLPLVRCAADPSSPAVVALVGQAHAPVIDGDRALVGALRTARTIADTANAIARMEPPARDRPTRRVALQEECVIPRAPQSETTCGGRFRLEGAPAWKRG